MAAAAEAADLAAAVAASLEAGSAPGGGRGAPGSPGSPEALALEALDVAKMKVRRPPSLPGALWALRGVAPRWRPPALSVSGDCCPPALAHGCRCTGHAMLPPQCAQVAELKALVRRAGLAIPSGALERSDLEALGRQVL